MGTTSKGLDYPEPTGYVAAGAAAIRELAQDTDAAIGGALFRATVATESVANNTDDKLQLTLTVDDSPVFTNPDGNLITYTGPKAVALVAATVTWAASAAGTRRIGLLLNGDEVAFERVTPDAEAVAQAISWPMVLTSGDKLGLQVRQSSGGALDVTAAKFRAVILGVAP